MSRFAVGQRVVIVRSAVKARIGLVVTAVRPAPFYGFSAHYRSVCQVGDPGVFVDIPSMPDPNLQAWYPDAWLEPYRDDSSEKSTWSALPEWARRACGRKERV